MFKRIYEDAEQFWPECHMGEQLIDVEASFQLWRFRHMKTVERIIGRRPGTGGSAGAAYLEGALARSFFPELWSIRTRLQARPRG